MLVQFKISGVDKTSLLKIGSISIDNILNARDTYSFQLVDEAGSYRPVVGEIVIMTAVGVKVFEGFIDEIEESLLITNNATLLYNITCVDYNQLCDRYTVSEVYDNELAGDIVKDIILNLGFSIGTTNVEDGPAITKAVFNRQTVTECLNEISDLTGYDWYIDYNRQLYFFARETNSAPVEFTDANDNFISVKVIRNTQQYRNRQYVRAGYDTTSDKTENFTGDGALQTFTLKFPVAQVPTITLNSVAVTVGIRGVETGKDWYWSKNDNTITQDDSGTVLTSSDALAVTYKGLFPIVVRADAESQILERKTVEGGDGIYESVEEDSSIESQDTAMEKAEALLRRYGAISERVEIVSDNAFITSPVFSSVKAGQLLTLDIAAHNISGTYLVQSVQITDFNKSDGTSTASTLRWKIVALSGENIGGWVDFFKKMANSGKKYVIRENEVLIRITYFTETVTVNEALTVSSAIPESRIGYGMIGFMEVT